MAKSIQSTKGALTSLHRLEFILQHKSDSLLREVLGIGFSQIQIMEVLNRQTLLSQKAVALELYQTEANVSRQVQVLKKKGLVSIGRAKNDKRIRQLSLTNQGSEIYRKAEKLLASQHKEMMKLISKAEAEVFDRVIAYLLLAA